MKPGNPPLYNQTYINVGKGPVVILLHGLFGNLNMWKTTVDVLKNDFNVIIPRLPLIDLPAENISMKYLTKVLHDFIEWHQLTDVTLIGHALGGQVSLMYTHQYPQNVHKLILVSSAGLIAKSPFLDADSKPDSYDYVHSKVEEAFYQKDFVSDKLVDEIYSVVQNIPRRLILGMIARSSKQANVSSFLSKIDHPVLLVWGLHDRITPPETALHFHDLLPNSEVKLIDYCGHLPMVEKPAAFTKYLQAFLQEKNHFKNWYA